MRSVKFLPIALGVAVAMIGGGRLAGAEPAAVTCEAFEVWLAGSTTLQAHFVQRLESGVLGGDIEERGVVYLERPGRMVWKYIDPEEKIALIADGEIQMYVPEDRQLFVSPVPAEGNLLPRLLLGEAPLRELFRVGDSGLGQDPMQEGVFRLTPISVQDSFESVEIHLETTGALREAIVTDSAGNIMEYRFESWRRNRKLPMGVFKIEVARGTEILRPD